MGRMFESGPGSQSAFRTANVPESAANQVKGCRSSQTERLLIAASITRAHLRDLEEAPEPKTQPYLESTWIESCFITDTPSVQLPMLNTSCPETGFASSEAGWWPKSRPATGFARPTAGQYSYTPRRCWCLHHAAGERLGQSWVRIDIGS